MPARLLTLFVAASLIVAGEDAPLRDMVDRLRDLESQVALIERESALPVEPAALWAGAARGMVQAVDPHGRYLTADEVAIYGLGVEPMAVGLGFDWLQLDDGRVQITRVVRASPAAAKAFHPGMEILAINDLEPAKSSRRQVAEALARSGETVRLRVRSIDNEVQAVELRRSELDDDGIAAISQPAPGIISVRIARFLPARGDAPISATASGLESALKAADGLRAAVIDLRGCSGGNLQSAVECAAGWTPPGSTIVQQFGRDPARARTWTASNSPRLPSVPLVVLVDAGTASAAEVLAHALRQYRHAPVIGAATVGKGTVQQLFLLPRGDAMLLTVARMRTPSGVPLDIPLQPDVPITQPGEATFRRWRGEAAGTTPLPVDQQLERAVELATALAIREGK